MEQSIDLPCPDVPYRASRRQQNFQLHNQERLSKQPALTMNIDDTKIKSKPRELIPDDTYLIPSNRQSHITQSGYGNLNAQTTVIQNPRKHKLRESRRQKSNIQSNVLQNSFGIPDYNAVQPKSNLLVDPIVLSARQNKDFLDIRSKESLQNYPTWDRTYSMRRNQAPPVVKDQKLDETTNVQQPQQQDEGLGDISSLMKAFTSLAPFMQMMG